MPAGRPKNNQKPAPVINDIPEGQNEGLDEVFSENDTDVQTPAVEIEVKEEAKEEVKEKIPTFKGEVIKNEPQPVNKNFVKYFDASIKRFVYREFENDILASEFCEHPDRQKLNPNIRPYTLTKEEVEKEKAKLS